MSPRSTASRPEVTVDDVRAVLASTSEPLSTPDIAKRCADRVGVPVYGPAYHVVDRAVGQALRSLVNTGEAVTAIAGEPGSRHPHVAPPWGVKRRRYYLLAGRYEAWVQEMQRRVAEHHDTNALAEKLWQRLSHAGHGETVVRIRQDPQTGASQVEVSMTPAALRAVVEGLDSRH